MFNLWLRITGVMAVTTNAARLARAEILFFRESRYTDYTRLVYLYYNLTGLPRRLSRFFSLDPVVALYLKYYFTHFLLRSILFSTSPIPSPTLVLKWLLLGMFLGLCSLCVLFYFLSSTYDCHPSYDDPDLFLHVYWMLKYGCFYQWDTSADRVTRLYKSVRYEKTACLILISFFFFLYAILSSNLFK